MIDPRQSALGSRRSAFTLVEMLVSLAVIVVALAVVVTAFTITTRTARQAAAFAEVQGWVRQFASQIQEDLRHCEPSRGPFVVVGRVQPAALTVEDIAAQRRLRVLIGDREAVPSGYDPLYNPTLNPEYSDPRADILMFFTQRPTTSRAPALDPAAASPPQRAIAAGARSAPVQVVYGHASRGEYVRAANGTSTWSPTITHIEDVAGGSNLSQLPAGEWHLVRRVAIPAALTLSRPYPPSFSAQLARLVRCEPTNTEAGDVVDFYYEDYLRFLNATLQANAAEPPYTIYARVSDVATAVDDVLYADPGQRHIATVLDTPPVDLRHNLGVHMLPGCAWFQVEFLMPEDARNSLDYNPPVAADAGAPNPLPTQRNQMPHWTQVDPGQTYVFLPDTPENRTAVARSNRLRDFTRVNPGDASLGAPLADLPHLRVRLWPYAVRITVRVYDPRGRLPDPVIRTIVHRFE